MPVETVVTNTASPSDDQKPSEPKTNGSARSRWLHVLQAGSRFATSLGALGGIASVAWAAYTYSNESTEQRRQDLLSSFNLVDGDLGNSTIAKIQTAITQFYSITDSEWYIAVANRNSALAASDDAAFAKAVGDMQNWISHNILVKDGKHDANLHAYQDALNAIKFTYQYAQADYCNATVVGLKFRQNVYDFFYYFPGTFDLNGVKMSTNAAPVPEQAITDLTWLTNQIGKCSAELRSLPSWTGH